MGRQILFYSVLWVANYQVLRTTDLEYVLIDELGMSKFLIYLLDASNVKDDQKKATEVDKKPLLVWDN